MISQMTVTKGRVGEPGVHQADHGKHQELLRKLLLLAWLSVLNEKLTYIERKFDHLESCVMKAKNGISVN